MIRELNKNVLSLSKKSVKASPFKDKQDGLDLLDTLQFYHETCVGMAANMIGVHKNIIAFVNGEKYEVMFNPEIVVKKEEYITREGCLCHTGVRETKRYRIIKVAYQDMNGKKKVTEYNGFVAQIIQHEIDHCHGIII